MSRLRHDENSFFRSLQVSRYKLFAFVEGKHSDPYFYGSIMEAVIPNNDNVYRILRAHELPSAAGGKQSLLKFYKYLRNRKGFVTEFKNKKTGILFFIDKDMDDITRKKVRSGNVCYTEYYSVENYIFVHGDIAKGIALASSLEVAVVRNELGEEKIWRETVAKKWFDWLKICTFALIHDVDCGCGFGIFSRINKPCDAPVDGAEHQRILFILQSKSGFAPLDFTKEMNRIGANINSKIISYDHDRHFNGKWYVPFLEQTIKAIANTTPYESAGIHQRIKSSVLSTLNFEATWANHFKTYVNTLLNQLQ